MFRMTELECSVGHLSSCSDSDDNSSGEGEEGDRGSDGVMMCGCSKDGGGSNGGVTSGVGGGNPVQAACCDVTDDVMEGSSDCLGGLEAENDVDDETMSGDNDVFNSHPQVGGGGGGGNNPSSLQVNTSSITIIIQ